MMLVRLRCLVRAVVRVYICSARFSSGCDTCAGTRLKVVARAHEFPAREDELDHEECGRDARAAAIEHDGV